MFTATPSRYAAFALAVSVALAMLAAVGALADRQVASAQFAAAATPAAKAPKA